MKRITPACAGKTRPISGKTRLTEDHPRVCGENVLVRRDGRSDRGSPPRVRGKPINEGRARKVTRITPACAGKTILALLPAVIVKDHPRVCGENPVHRQALRRLLGSPPRVRGKLALLDLGEVQVRITPACAGKTRSASTSPRLSRDHPRVCGENSCNPHKNGID